MAASFLTMQQNKSLPVLPQENIISSLGQNIGELPAGWQAKWFLEHIQQLNVIKNICLRRQQLNAFQLIEHISFV